MEHPPVKRRPDGTIISGVLNPGGRPHALKAFREWLRENALDKAQDALLECLSDSDGRVRMAAVKEIFDRLFGRAPQPITGEDGKPVTLAIGAELLMAVKRLGGGDGG